MPELNTIRSWFALSPSSRSCASSTDVLGIPWSFVNCCKKSPTLLFILFHFPPLFFPLKALPFPAACPYPCPSTAARGSCHTVASRYLWNDASVRKRVGQLGFGHFLHKSKFVRQEICIILVLRHISLPWGSERVIQRGDALLLGKSS